MKLNTDLKLSLKNGVPIECFEPFMLFHILNSVLPIKYKLSTITRRSLSSSLDPKNETGYLKWLLLLYPTSSIFTTTAYGDLL